MLQGYRFVLREKETKSNRLKTRGVFKCASPTHSTQQDLHTASTTLVLGALTIFTNPKRSSIQMSATDSVMQRNINILRTA